MALVSRTAVSALLAGAALFATGCGGESNNRGKIEGKWKVTAAPGLSAATLQRLWTAGATPYMEFRTDGTMTADTDFKQPPPGTPLFERPLPPILPPPRHGTYKLLSGDRVRFAGTGDAERGFFDRSDAQKVSVVIDGDRMTFTDPGGIVQLTRWK